MNKLKFIYIYVLDVQIILRILVSIKREYLLLILLILLPHCFRNKFYVKKYMYIYDL